MKRIATGIEHGYSIEDTTLALMAKKGVILVPTDGDHYIFTKMIEIGYPENKDASGTATAWRAGLSERLLRAIKKGVIISAGSDDYLDLKMPFAEASKHTLIGYFESGATISQVLQFATINASRQLNWSDRIGILKTGYLADMVAVGNNIDKDIHEILQVSFVMKNGEIVLNKSEK